MAEARSPFFIFVTGGVLSSLGKGLTASVLGALLKARGASVRLRKIDPYLNIDPGTMSPYQHGEVFVTEDGFETDLDLGHYERFTEEKAKKTDYLTTGQIYQSVLHKERRGDYLGETVMVVPHIVDAIKDFMRAEIEAVDFVIIEIGGTVGDIESLPFLEAVRQMRVQMPGRVCVLHVGWVPYVRTAGEFKTKPMQHSVRELQRAGIQPDVFLLRSESQLPKGVVEKLSLLCNVPAHRVVMGKDESNIYHVPVTYHREGLDRAVLDFLGAHWPEASIEPWKKLLSTL